METVLIFSCFYIFMLLLTHKLFSSRTVLGIVFKSLRVFKSSFHTISIRYRRENAYCELKGRIKSVLAIILAILELT